MATPICYFKFLLQPLAFVSLLLGYDIEQLWPDGLAARYGST